MARLTAAQQKAAFLALLSKLSPDLAQAFKSAVEQAGSAINLGELTAAIEAGKVEEAIRIIQRGNVYFYALDDTIRAAYLAGGAFAVGNIPTIRNRITGVRAVIGFNGRHLRAERWVKRASADLVEGIAQNQIGAVRKVIAAGLEAGRASGSVALDIAGRVNAVTGRREGGIISLTSSQTDMILRARDNLLSGDPKLMRLYLTLSSRDRTFDARIRAAINDGKKMSVSDVDKILNRHKDKMFLKRGKDVAQQYTFSALSAGQREGWAQLIETGAVKASDVTKRWQHNKNIPARPDHVDMNGTVVAFDQKFKMKDGTLMDHDHDEAGGAKHNAHCHCYTFYRLRKGRNG